MKPWKRPRRPPPARDAVRIVGVDVPRSMERFRGRLAVQYVPVGHTSLDWAASADWEHPTSLMFKHETMTSQRFRMQLPVRAEGPIPPGVLVDAVVGLVYETAGALQAAGRVMDRDDYCGIDVEREYTHHPVVILKTTMTTWPAIEGVTTRVRDRTL